MVKEPQGHYWTATILILKASTCELAIKTTSNDMDLYKVVHFQPQKEAMTGTRRNMDARHQKAEYI